MTRHRGRPNISGSLIADADADAAAVTANVVFVDAGHHVMG